MSKFDELEEKVKKVDPKDDPDKVKEVVKQIKDAHANDEIAEDEKTALIRAAKNKLGDNIDFKGA